MGNDVVKYEMPAGNFDMRLVVEEVFHKLGGVDGMVEWVKSGTTNRNIFYSQILPRLMPKEIKQQVTGLNGGSMAMSIRWDDSGGELLGGLPDERGSVVDVKGMVRESLGRPVKSISEIEVDGDGDLQASRLRPVSPVERKRRASGQATIVVSTGNLADNCVNMGIMDEF